jgi:hypothetical protein
VYGAALIPIEPRPLSGAEPPLEERYFERREVREAIAFAEQGGIAIHRNLDAYDGRLSRRGVVMRKPFLHVIGLRPRLEVWGRRYGLRPEWIQPEGRRRVAHYDVFGPLAEALIARFRDLARDRSWDQRIVK